MKRMFKNWLIKKLGGRTEAEYFQLRLDLRKSGTDLIYAMNHQHEKVYDSARHFYKLAGVPEPLCSSAAKQTTDDNWDRIH